MRKTTLIVASVLASVAVNVAQAAETKGDVTIKKGGTSASFKITPAKGNYIIKQSVASTIEVKQGTTPVAPVDGVYALDAKEYTVTVKLSAAAAADTKVSVYGYNTAEVEKYNTAIQDLTNSLTTSYNQAGSTACKNDPRLQALGLEVSKIQAEIDAAKLDVQADEAAEWAAYASFLNGTSVLNDGSIAAKIEKLSDDVVAAKANYDAHEAVKVAANYMTTVADRGVNALIAAYDAAADDIKAAFKASYDKDVKLVENWLEEANAAYEAGTCATYTKDAITGVKIAYVDGAKATIPTLINAIKSGNTALALQIAINDDINTEKAKVVKAQSALYQFLVNNVDDSQAPYAYKVNDKVNDKVADDRAVYEDRYAEELTKINAVLRLIDAVAQKNVATGEGENVKYTSYANKAAAQAELDAAIAKLNDIITTCKTDVQKLRSAYDAVRNDLDDLVKTKIDAINTSVASKDDTKAYYADKELKNIQKAYDDILNGLYESNAAHKDFTANTDAWKKYVADRDAAIEAINKAKAKIDNSIVEEDAYNASKATIKAKQEALDAAIAAVNAAKYECPSDDKYVYTIGDKFKVSIDAIQAEIDAITAKNEAAYTVKKNGAYNKGSVTSAYNFNTAAGDAKNPTLKYYTETKAGLVVNRFPDNKLDDAIDLINTQVDRLLAKVQEFHQTIDTNEAALKALKETVGEYGNVTVDGSTSGKTYSTAIAEYESQIEKNKKDYAAAMALDGNNTADNKNHYMSVVRIKMSSLDSRINADGAKFNDNKAKWEQNNINDACEKILTESERLIENANKALGVNPYDFDTYGKRYEDLNDQRDDLLAKVAADKQKVVDTKAAAAANGNKYTKEDLEVLKDVAADLDNNAAAIKELSDLAAKVAEEYAVEIDLNNKLNAAADKIQDLINGNAPIESIMDQAEDVHPDPTYYISALEVKVGKAQDAIDAYKKKADGTGKIKDSFEAETLYKDFYTKGDVKGLNDLIAEIQVTVDELITEAKAITKNSEAWDEANKYINTDNVAKTTLTYQGIIDKAENDIKEVSSNASKGVVNPDDETAAKKYFLDLLNAEKTEKENIATANETDYKNLMKNNVQAIIDRVDASVARVQALAQAADANEKAYKGSDYMTTEDGQVKSYNDALTLWAELSEYVAVKQAVNDGHYNDAQKEGWSVKLQEFRKAIELYDENTLNAYKKGQAAEDAFNGDLVNVKTAMAAFKASFDGEYSEAVTADNAERYKKFNNAYKALTDSYTEKINAVAALSRLEIAKDSEDLLLEAETGTSIFQYAEKIRGLKAKADADYDATVISSENDFYDLKEANKITALKYQKTVEDIANAYINDVNDKAAAKYNGLVPGVNSYKDLNTKYNDAIANMAGWDKSILNNGKPTNQDLLDVDAFLAKYAGAADPTEDNVTYKDLYFAQKWENNIEPALATMLEKVQKGLDTSTAAQWIIEKANKDALAKSEAAAIAGFNEIVEGNVVKGSYSNAYKNLEKTVNNNIKETEKDGTAYGNYANLHAALGQFGHLETRNLGTAANPNWQSHTALYWQAYDANEAWKNNDKDFNEHMVVVNDLRAKADAAVDFANAMLSRYDVANDIDAVFGGMFGLDNYEANVEEDHTNGDSHAHNKTSDWAKGYQDLIKANITNVYTSALENEYKDIIAEIKDLQFDYDKASAQMITGGAEVDEMLANWKEEIKKIDAKNSQIYNDWKFGKMVNGKKVYATKEATQAAYLELEKTIGALKCEIKQNSDADDKLLETKVIGGLNDALAAVNNTLNATKPTHKPVVDDYAADLASYKEKAAAIQTLIDEAETDRSILIDAKNLQKDIDALKLKADQIKEDVDTEEAKWEYSDIISSKIAEDFDTQFSYLEEILKVAAYDVKETAYDSEGELYNVLDKEMADILATVKANKGQYEGQVKNGKMFNDVDANTYANWYSLTIKSINQSWLRAANYNSEEVGWTSNYKGTDVYNYLNNNSDLLTADDYNKFYNLFFEIASVHNNAAYYRYNFVKTAVVTDELYKVFGQTDIKIDGSKYLDKDGNQYNETLKWIDADGNDAYHEVVAKYNEAIAKFDQLQKDIKAARFMVGDVDGNLDVNINDYAKLATILLNAEEDKLEGKAFNIADANRDKKIDVADLAAIVNIITDDYSTQHVRSFIAADNSNDQVTVDVENDVLSIGINNDVNYVGMQMDITLPSGASVLTEELAARAQNHELMVNNLGNNKYRVMVISGENEAFGGHEGALFNLGLTNFHGTVAIDNIIFTDANAHSYKFTVNGGATAINGVDAQQTVGEKIYSVGGQLMNGLKKGVNIVKGAAKTVKVIK